MRNLRATLVAVTIALLGGGAGPVAQVAAADNGVNASTSVTGLVTGQYTNASGGTSYTQCRLDATASDAPRSDDSGSDVGMRTTVTCSTGNVAVSGNSTLYDNETRTPLAVASDFAGTLSNASSSGSYFDSDDARELFYQAHVVLTFPGDPTGKWTAHANGANCTGISTGRVECWPNVTFTTDWTSPGFSDT